MDLHYLLDHLASDPFFKKFHQLNLKLAEVVEDYGLVSFVPLNVQVQQMSRYIMCTTLSFDSNSINSSSQSNVSCMQYQQQPHERLTQINTCATPASERVMFLCACFDIHFKSDPVMF